MVISVAFSTNFLHLDHPTHSGGGGLDAPAPAQKFGSFHWSDLSSTIEYVPFGENLVKIAPFVLEILLVCNLQGIIKKE